MILFSSVGNWLSVLGESEAVVFLAGMWSRLHLVQKTFEIAVSLSEFPVSVNERLTGSLLEVKGTTDLIELNDLLATGGRILVTKFLRRIVETLNAPPTIATTVVAIATRSGFASRSSMLVLVKQSIISRFSTEPEN